MPAISRWYPGYERAPTGYNVCSSGWPAHAAAAGRCASVSVETLFSCARRSPETGKADTHQIPFFSAQVRLCWWPQRAATPPSALSWKVGTSHSPKELSTLYHTYLQWTSLAHCNARPLGWESGLQCWGRREWQLWSAVVANPRPPSAASTKPAIVRAPKKQKGKGRFFFPLCPRKHKSLKEYTAVIPHIRVSNVGRRLLQLRLSL